MASIVNISSSRDRMSQPKSKSYITTKDGIAALIHALAVSPRGAGASELYLKLAGLTPTIRYIEGPNANQQPTGRVGNPMDITNMVLYLCSDKAGFNAGENSALTEA